MPFQHKLWTFLSLFYCSVTYSEQLSVVTEYIPPYQVKNPDGSLGGFSTEVLTALLSITGDTADIKVMPWARSYKEALTIKNTLIYSISHTKMRDPLFYWIGKLKPLRVYVWGLKSKFKQPVNNINELKPYLIAVSKSSSTGQYINSLSFPHVYSVTTEDQTMLMLYHNRIDLLVGSELLFKTRIKNLDLDFNKVFKMFEIKELRSHLKFAFNKQSDIELVKRFQRAFLQLEKSGKVNDIRKKWNIAPINNYVDD